MNMQHTRSYITYPGIIAVILLICSTEGTATNMTTAPDGKGYRFDKDGWTYLHIEGAPYERGYQCRLFRQAITCLSSCLCHYRILHVDPVKGKISIPSHQD